MLKSTSYHNNMSDEEKSLEIQAYEKALGGKSPEDFNVSDLNASIQYELAKLIQQKQEAVEE